jgi:hypothetical protein
MKKIIMIFLVGLIMASTVNAQKFIQPIPGQDKLTIEPTSGREKLTDGTSIIVDQNYRNYNLDQPCSATAATSAEVYALNNEASFDDIFATDAEKDKVALTVPQVKNAIAKYTIAFKNTTVFFLVKNGGRFYVLQVMVRDGAAGSPENVKVETWKSDDYLSFGSRDRFIARKN